MLCSNSGWPSSTVITLAPSPQQVLWAQHAQSAKNLGSRGFTPSGFEYVVGGSPPDRGEFPSFSTQNYQCMESYDVEWPWHLACVTCLVSEGSR